MSAVSSAVVDRFSHCSRDVLCCCCRERAERERAGRAAAAERERREKAEAAAAAEQQLRERERQRREILDESKAAADAVEKHFKESFRLASQKVSILGEDAVIFGLHHDDTI